MELKLIKQHEKYLGHPSLKGKSQKQTYLEIKQSFIKIQGQKVRFWSKVGREKLIKVVAKAIPTDVMSVFNRVKCLDQHILIWTKTK